jgi:hypothetical protein
MKDKEFLQWLHERLSQVHKENVDVDYMYKLRAIIDSYPEDKVTPNACVNSLKYSQTIFWSINTVLAHEEEIREQIKVLEEMKLYHLVNDDNLVKVHALIHAIVAMRAGLQCE